MKPNSQICTKCELLITLQSQRWLILSHAFDKAATPGRVLPSNRNKTSTTEHHLGTLQNINKKYKNKVVLPSRSSSDAPPPVLTWLTRSSVPYLAQQVAVSPPPNNKIEDNKKISSVCCLLQWPNPELRQHALSQVPSRTKKFSFE